MSTPSLLAGLIESNDSNEVVNEAQVRSALGGFTTPALDEFRADLPKIKTSELIVALVNPQLDGLLANCKSQEEAQKIAVSALLAVADEIDRRIPIAKS